jgi:putative redox protein
MKASARHSDGTFTHVVDVRGHQVTVDEPAELGGADEGPSPQELLAASIASCTAVTMRMYAARKGWEVGQLEVECEYEPPERGAPAQFNLVLRIPDSCTPEQVEALTRIAGKCPVHRVLEMPSVFEQSVELVSPA